MRDCWGAGPALGWGQENLPWLMIERKEWEMCEEREGEEGRGAGQNDVLDHA